MGAAITPSPAAEPPAELHAKLREYYRHPSIRRRMREFLGGTTDQNVTAAYITGADGRSDFAQPSPPSCLAKFLKAGFEIERSLWDKRSLPVDLDIEYVNFDSPSAAWTDPVRAVELQRPVIDATLCTLRWSGIDPLVLLTGRGFHLVWSVDRDSVAFRRLGRLGHVNASLAARYAGAHAPSGAAVPPELGHAYAGLGVIAEFIGHRVLAQSAVKSAIPVEMTAIEAGPGRGGREIVSFDVSEYGDPLHQRHIRLPFSIYLKPRRAEGNSGPARSLPPIFEIPLGSLSFEEAIRVARSPDNAVQLSRNVRTSIPDYSDPMEALLDEYESSALAAFHREFYCDSDAPVTGQAGARVSTAPACLNWLLDHPNDWLLRPAALQFVSRVLMALNWNPRAIAHLIAGCYERDLDWGDQWVRLDPLNRALFYTRLFCGMIVTGVDQLIDLNCVSHREKGYCLSAECPANLVLYRDKLLEKRRLG